MTKTTAKLIVMAAFFAALPAAGQYKSGDVPSSLQKDSSAVVISLEDALRIALSENVAVKVADKEIERSEYAKKGTYSSLFPQINGSGSYQRTIKK